MATWAAKLLTGNLKGAWIDVCSGLRTVWFDLCTGMLTVFEKFIKSVKAAWAPISKEIATSLQKAFESTGGTLYSKPMQSIPQLELNQRLLQAHTAENSQGWFSGGGLSEESRRKLGIAQWHREEQDAEMQRALKEDPLGGTIHEDMIEFHRKRASSFSIRSGMTSTKPCKPPIACRACFACRGRQSGSAKHRSVPKRRNGNEGRGCG